MPYTIIIEHLIRFPFFSSHLFPVFFVKISYLFCFISKLPIVFIFNYESITAFIKFRNSSEFWIIRIDYLFSLIVYIITCFYPNFFSFVVFHPFIARIRYMYIFMVFSPVPFFCLSPFGYGNQTIFLYCFHLLGCPVI